MHAQIVIRGKPDIRNEIPMYLRFTEKRTPYYIKLAFKCSRKSWDSKSHRYKKTVPMAAAKNKKLSDILSNAEEIITIMKINDISGFDAFKRSFLNIKDRIDFYGLFEGYINNNKIPYSTNKTYHAVIKLLKTYYPELDAATFTKEMANEFAKHLFRSELSSNTKRQYIVILKAIWEKVIDDIPNPFSAIKKPKKQKTNPHYWNQNDIDIIVELYNNVKDKDDMEASIYFKELYKSNNKDKKMISSLENMRPTTANKIKEALRFYIFCCYTGLRFSDAHDLKKKYFYYENSAWWITKVAYKTKNTSGTIISIPLLHLAIELIDIEQEVTFNINYAALSDFLKKISAILGFETNITTHSARHSFARIAASKGIRRETLQKILGHNDEKMTAWYGDIGNETLKNEFFTAFKN